VDSLSPSAIIGYYTLSYASVIAPASALKNYPHPAPALKLVRMGVDLRYRGNRFGEQLLMDVIRKTAFTLAADSPAAVIGLFVDAKEGAVEFYRQYGFIEVSEEEKLSLFLPMSTCIEVTEAGG